MMKPIQVKGTIVSDSDAAIYRWLGYDVTAPKDIQLPEDDSDVTVEINSPGGDVYAGAEIYTKLRGYTGKVNANIVGVAASAASVIAMAGDHVAISPMGQMMIHNASARIQGNATDHKHLADVLDGVSAQIADSYAARTGKNAADFQALMDKETYFTAKESVEQGLADEIMFAENEAPAVAAGFGVLPTEVLNKARRMMSNEPASKSTVVLKAESIKAIVVEAIKPLQEQIDALKKPVAKQNTEPEEPQPKRFLF
ncbi:head maturation protease, ClpP-related [Loigolactobacillus jiayinensis]|uniref:ATP-dependent Clp protease proteolytic subunit n=1 Tax=Loigolactobacillus jiayinensis TaxID=2486016 RepID=A0ABW1RC58_9LACO|nr:head maturation protease, ClpP-related [Loigolactobacillus jiayinensis]